MADHDAFDAIREAKRQWQERWPEAADAMASATSIMRAQQIVLAAVDAVLRPMGLTFARFEALVLLSFTREGQLPLGKMGTRLMIHPTSVTNIVDRLSDDELVVRIPHPSDRRATLAKITPKGRALASEAADAINAISFGLGSLSARQHEELFDVVRTLRVDGGELS